MDPMGRHRVLEATSAQVLALVTVPFVHPGVPRTPDWTQLLGLGFLLGSCLLTLHTWRLLVTYGARARADFPRQSADERRLRRSALCYPLVTAVLIPIPPTWQWLWFALTLASGVLGAISLWRCTGVSYPRIVNELLAAATASGPHPVTVPRKGEAAFEVTREMRFR
ncbi:hypothetical protein [Nocardia seriolae]|uniref:Uncharacterized protein n=2 Tax=Nocardia seriolae TaxID=37332 RepID=A0ABC9Z4A6_9NOCA|nr:hypothetical protein [Nocardia seriolae]OJF79841.1 hypothetical protein NS14008_12335 [Nocardia seriolae]PSK27625.1 hypothetical protein C6575_30840 [Nocardia seriolae]QOW36221.1 hypothetical protein IMZ23_15910 [Nocardia seriolae]QUN16272.1 hypothetical protein KEC46_29040 [Nocardia seriolae]RLP27317.1 hypothetical protein D6158_30260 [Nocardia seriolae]